jgi:hypothetical protein
VTSVNNRYYDPSTDQFLSIDPAVAATLKAAESISDGELIVPGGSGKVFVSPTQYSSAAEAQEQLSLPETPDGYYQIPISSIPGLGKFSEVNPDFGFGGGGLEATTGDSIDVGGIPFIPF